MNVYGNIMPVTGDILKEFVIHQGINLTVPVQITSEIIVEDRKPVFSYMWIIGPHHFGNFGIVKEELTFRYWFVVHQNIPECLMGLFQDDPLAWGEFGFNDPVCPIFTPILQYCNIGMWLVQPVCL